MNINGINISEAKLANLTGLEHKIPQKYVSKDNQQPSSAGNGGEGSETGGSLNSDEEYGDNTRLDWATNHGTPGTRNKRVVIQSELVGNGER